MTTPAPDIELNAMTSEIGTGYPSSKDRPATKENPVMTPSASQLQLDIVDQQKNPVDTNARSSTSIRVDNLVTLMAPQRQSFNSNRSIEGSRVGNQSIMGGRQDEIEDENQMRAFEEEIINPTQILPPVDSGIKAWLFLIAATYIELITFGFSFSIGVLHLYWTNHLFTSKEDETILTLTATFNAGLLYFAIAASGPLFTAYPRYPKILQVVGLLTGSLTIIASGFATKPWHLLVTLGLLYPICAIAWFPCATLLFEWFHSRRGLASGVMYSGSGLGGFAYPFLIEGLLGKFGYKVSMIALGIGYISTGCIALVAIKRRVPLLRYDHSTSANTEIIRRRRPRVDWSFTKERPLYLGMLTIGLTSMGSFIPSLWLPSFVDEAGFRKPNGTALIAILNASSVPGNALLGWFSDHLPLKWAIQVSCAGGALSCAFLWGFGTNVGVLTAFAIIFGLFFTSFTTLWTKMIGAVANDDPAITAFAYSLFGLVRGIGNFSSGPISDKLLKVEGLRGVTGAYGFHNYGALLIYTAVVISVGSIPGLFFKHS
ncbi:uncharacterized protein L201_007161 [Kwoniella dendrophila CBS 6074]|uniref:Monocarboxylic acid transporter n=1 Tax=Kwoniella dendrophila CBS 6074 TaxID=1295534 RepID=A0AAX4K3M6_9TREE